MNRKETIRKYKDTPTPMGVVCIRNVAAKKAFIDSSVNTPALLNRIRFQLEHGSHPNRKLQEEWNAAGAAAFTFETLDTLEPSKEAATNPAKDLATLKAMWRETLAKQGELY